MPGKQLNPQIQCHINNASRMKKNLEQLRSDRMKMEGSIPDWRVDQSIQKGSVFQCATRVEAVAVQLQEQ